MNSIKFRGMEVSPIGIGTAAWGGGINGGDQMYGSRLSANDLSYIFRSAVSQDINFFDTSPAFGTSETALGYASKSNQSVHFSTKFVPSSFQRRNALRKSAEHSMAILGVDSLNFFGIQAPIDIDKWTKELIPLLDNGTIKNAGVSNFNLSEIKKTQFILERAGHSLSYVQSHYSIVSNSERDKGIIDWCEENDALFFAHMVLEQGALTRKYSTSSMFESRSYRASLYNRSLMNSLAPLKMRMQKLSDSYSVSDAQIAIAWSVGRGAIPIIGVTRASQVEGVVSALDLILDEDDMEMLENTANSLKVKIRGFWELDR